MARSEDQAGDCHSTYIIDLPNELLMMIVDHITLFEDLTATSLTCKTLRAFAILRLHRNLTIDLTDLLNYFERTDKLPDINVKHLKSLTFSDKKAEAHEPNGSEPQRVGWKRVQTERAVNAILQAIPDDQLERVDWLSEKRFHYPNFELLLRTQINLRQLEVFRLDDYPGSLFSALRGYDLRWVDKLILDASSPRSLEWGNYLLRNAHKVSDLTIKLPDIPQPRSSIPWELHQIVRHPESVHSGLFSHHLTSGPSSTLPDPLSLTHLHLSKVNFCSSFKAYTRSFDMPSLTRLSITHCTKVEQFLNVLCEVNALPTSLKTLTLLHGNDKEGVVTRALCQLSQRLGGLETLVVEIGRCKELPPQSLVSSHRQTLRTLVIHGYMLRWDPDYSNERVYDSDELRDLLSSCPGLEQLSIGVRPPVIDNYNRLPWCWKDVHKVICAMNQLRVLHLTPSPYRDTTSYFQDAITDDIYSARVACIVTKMLQLNMKLCSDPSLELVRLGRDTVVPGFKAHHAVNSSFVYTKTSDKTSGVSAKLVDIAKLRFDEPANKIWKL